MIMSGKPTKLYALYENDEFLMLGTARELAEHMGCKVETVRWYTTPSGIKRLKKRKRGGYWVEVVDEWPEQE